jgi:hypothetical protein
MTSLTISESAYDLILRELERSDIDDPAIALVYTRDTYPLPDEVLRLPPAQRDKARQPVGCALVRPASGRRSVVLLLAGVEGQNERLVPR